MKGHFEELIRFKPFYKEHFYKTLGILFALSTFLYTCLRAHSLSITHDEAITYLNHVSGAFLDIVTYQLPIKSNNHLLNSLLIKIFTNVLGVNEFVIRIPALIGHGLYLLGIYKILNLFLKSHFLLLGMGLLVFHSFILELFSCARGYSLGLGFMVIGLYYFFKEIGRNKFGDNIKNNVIASTMLALSVLSHLAFFNVFISAMGIFLISGLVTLIERTAVNNPIQKRHLYKNLSLTILPSLLFIIGIYTYPVIKMIKAGNEFTYGGTRGLWKDTVSSLIEVTLSESSSINPNVILISKLLIGIFIFISFLVILWIRWKRIKLEPVSNILVWLMSILFFCSLSVILQHWIFSIKYPIDRYAVYFVPIFFLLVLGVWKSIQILQTKSIVIALNLLFCFGIVALMINSVRLANLSYYRQWKYDASTKDMVSYLANLSENKELEDNSVRIGINWIFEPSINFYILKDGIKWIKKVDRDGPDGEFDYYYVNLWEEEVIKKYGVRIIKEYNLSNTFLAERKELVR